MGSFGVHAAVAAILGVIASGCVVLDYQQAAEEAERIQEDASQSSRFDRAREGLGSGFVPEVTGDCATDLASIEEVRQIRAEEGLDGPEQVALRALVEATAECPDADG